MYKIKFYRKYVQVENKRIELYYGTGLAPPGASLRSKPRSAPRRLGSQLPFDFSLLNNQHLTASSFDFSMI